VGWGPLGGGEITLDCDVVNADGGTRCAAITGAWVALAIALRGAGLESALVRQVAAISAGILELEGWEGRQGLLLDLEYEEDHRAAVDTNLVAARPAAGGPLEIVEFQSTGEGRSVKREEGIALMDMGLQGCETLMVAQRVALA